MDKTMKMKAFVEAQKPKKESLGDLKDVDVSRELEKKTALLIEEQNKSVELLKTIVHLRESVRQEQTRADELTAKLTKLSSVEDNQLARKNAELEEERKHSLEYMRTIEQLRETIRQDQTKMAEVSEKYGVIEARDKKIAELEARIDQLTDILDAITKLATTGKLDSEE